MFSWPWPLTCWSWEPGARWCVPLDLCQVQTRCNPLMSVAPRSCPGSSVTGSGYQSCRCQKTLDLKVQKCFSYFLKGFVEAISIPQRRYRASLLPHGGLRQRVSYKNAPPASGRNSTSYTLQRGRCLLWPICSRWRTVLPLTSLNITAAGVLTVSASTGPIGVLDKV